MPTKRQRELAQKRALETEQRMIAWYAQGGHMPPDGSFAMHMWLLGYESALREVKRKAKEGRDA